MCLCMYILYIYIYICVCVCVCVCVQWNLSITEPQGEEIFSVAEGYV